MKTLIAILRLYWRHYPGWFLSGIGIGLLAALASIGLMATAGWYLGATAMTGATSVGTTLAFNTIYPGSLIRIAALTRTFGRYGERIVTHDATFRFLARMRLHVFDGISQLSFRRLRDFRSGELLARLTADVDALDGIYLRVILPLFTAILATLGLLVALHGINGPMALAIAIILLATLIVLPWQAARIGVALGRRIAFSAEALRLRYIDLLRGQVELIMAGRLNDQISSIQRAADKIKQLQDQLSLHDLRGRTLISLAGGAALVAALLVGSWAYERGEMSEAVLLLSLLAVVALIELLAPIRRGLLDIGRTLYAGQRILPLIADQAKEDTSDLEDHGAVRLAIERVDFAYSAKAAPVLRDFSLSLRSGEAIGIVGSSGAGKSTLLSLVAGLLDPMTGRIRLDYEDGRMAHLTPRIGLLTQRTELFRQSLAFNLRIADPRADTRALETVMDEAHLTNLLNRLPKRLEQTLGDDGQGLSGGESRRLTLARLLLFKPDLWLLDEATEGLDQVTAHAVLATLRAVTRDKALLFVTHKKAEAALADRLLVLKENEAPVLVARADRDQWQALLSSLR
ncbi:thiol reductant ABC exporter subunit CydC [Cohaesibacter celericrescens]|uniref:Thiol reductant ABC exporter subunit CydC n=1 Tax=Cohaesibacter celericrescens TaxID=2067669 RepID=A0A2N5XRI4_9HYPH|nr:thiol reductant ABC exporter subunit CydC [Cohaesibacter celericrescens]PLW77028.1 thiol reductant ABC exporter subunit CydC [Cohaesibacter celericrescens]